VDIKILNVCEKELKKFPQEVLEDLLDAIYVVHAFQKKSQKTPTKTIELVKKRIRSL